MSICSEIYDLIQQHLKEILKLRNSRKIKEDNSYVTDGDLLCQKIIIDYISALNEDYEIISEEMEISNFQYCKSKNYIIVDPIDGTENFTSGLKEWGVSVCIYKNDQHYESMLALPELNEKIITGDKFEHFSSRIYGISSSLTKKDLEKITEGFEYRIMGCAVYNLFNVIRGSFFQFENFKGAKSWDIIAGLNLALENNLIVKVNEKQYNGQFLYPNKRYCFKIQQQ
jgi:fructose-1,6-bisphosphatase/inositol monophosphatase family enzyme